MVDGYAVDHINEGVGFGAYSKYITGYGELFTHSYAIYLYIKILKTNIKEHKGEF